MASWTEFSTVIISTNTITCDPPRCSPVLFGFVLVPSDPGTLAAAQPGRKRNPPIPHGARPRLPHSNVFQGGARMSTFALERTGRMVIHLGAPEESPPESSTVLCSGRWIDTADTCSTETYTGWTERRHSRAGTVSACPVITGRTRKARSHRC